MNRLRPLFFLLPLLLSGCKVTKPVRPMESYEDPFEEQVSVINLPIDIPVDELQALLNQQLYGTLYEDNNLRDGDKMMVRAVKQGDIEIGIDSQSITYSVPLDLWIRYDLGISTAEATGQITLDFKTGFDIGADWEIRTQTAVAGYEWQQKPRVKMGFIDLPVGFIADLVLRNSKWRIATAIDDVVREQFNLRKTVEEAWKEMFNPILVSEDYNTWLTVNPQFIGMSPVQMGNNRIQATIYVETRPSVKIGQRPDPAFPRPLPPLRISEVEGLDFTLHLNTKVSYDEAERIAKQELIGESFSYGRRSVTIEDLEFFGQGNNIVINTTLSGTYNGSIYLLGTPVYNTLSNKLEIKNITYTLDTKNFLFRSAGWLMKSTIKNKIAENVNFLLDYNLKDLQEQFQEQLREYEVATGVILNGALEAVDIRNAYLTADGMMVDLALKGNLDVRIRGLSSAQD
ncbi:DUF4403 family protein [Phaeodactylibacter luteus]|uniref:DUF4403 family protein n=1 Tax=Phaeodactylibacter luteus TaxID=1564516 RepID=A0A5C6S4T9_9BACT|nr:DUF4403 family protein [Phaeodactylibacter luteus]TXB68821.1 DUF4403 family protein [Phaeodactylibacter luteus]